MPSHLITCIPHNEYLECSSIVNAIIHWRKKWKLFKNSCQYWKIIIKKSKKIPRNGEGKVVKNSLSFLLHLKTMHIYCACRYLHPTLHSKSGLVFTLQLNIYDLLAIYKAFPNKHRSDSGGIVVIKKGIKCYRIILVATTTTHSSHCQKNWFGLSFPCIYFFRVLALASSFCVCKGVSVVVPLCREVIIIMITIIVVWWLA